MKENKWQQFKQAVKAPPPERLAAIEYKSHFLQMLGITAVCIMLIYKGFWYIIFAFIFGIGVSYSQGMSAYQKYRILTKIQMPSSPDIENDPSPTRRRGRIINEVMGTKAKIITAVISVIIATMTIDPTSARWFVNIAYFMIIGTSYILIYYFPIYWVSNSIYKDMKGGKENAKKEKRRNGES